VVLELEAVLWFEFMSVEAVVVVAGAAAAGAALLSTFVALVCELTGGVALLVVAAALLPGVGFALDVVAVWSVEVAGAAAADWSVEVAGAAAADWSVEVAGAAAADVSLEVAGAADEAAAFSSFASGSFFGGCAALAAVLLSVVESCEVTVC